MASLCGFQSVAWGLWRAAIWPQMSSWQGGFGMLLQKWSCSALVCLPNWKAIDSNVWLRQQGRFWTVNYQRKLCCDVCELMNANMLTRAGKVWALALGLLADKLLIGHVLKYLDFRQTAKWNTYMGENHRICISAHPVLRFTHNTVLQGSTYSFLA